MGALSQRKGRRYEQQLVRQFREVLPGLPVRRGAQARGGAEAPDVDVPGLWVEAKHGRCVNLRAALAQALRDRSADRMPVAICKDDRAEAIVVLRLEDFLALWRATWTGGATR